MTTDKGRVDKVVRLVASSHDSWEDAARTAVAEAAKTIRELGYARVTDLDVRVHADGTRRFRTELEMSFRVDRYRTTPTGHRIRVRRLLVVGSHTLRRPEVEQTIVSQRRQGPLEVHVLVPREPAPLGPVIMGDPSSGVLLTDAQMLDVERAALDEAQQRLDDFIKRLQELDIAVSGEVGATNPVRAVQTVLGRAEFDEIVLATLSHAASKWLHLDVPSRLRRVTSIPVVHITTT